MAKGRTDKRGEFEFKKLPPGKYWVTYQHPEDGESFFVEVAEDGGTSPLELVVDLIAPQCYLVDIERNVTKPRGWTSPVIGEDKE